MPRIAQKVSYVLDRPTPDITPIIAKIMGNLLVYRNITKSGNGFKVDITVKNYSDTAMIFKLHETHQYPLRDADPEPKLISFGKDTDHIWQLEVRSGQIEHIWYNLPFVSEDEVNNLPELIVEGLDEARVNGAKANRGYMGE